MISYYDKNAVYSKYYIMFIMLLMVPVHCKYTRTLNDRDKFNKYNLLKLVNVGADRT